MLTGTEAVPFFLPTPKQKSILGKISVSIIKKKEARSNMKKQGRVLGLRCLLQHYLHVHHDRAINLAMSSEILAANM